MSRRHNLPERQPDPATPGARNIPVRSASRNDGHRPGHRGQNKARGSPPRQGNPRNNEPRRGDSRAQSHDHDGRRGNVPVKQRLGHDRDARHTIKARRRKYDYDDEAGSVAKNYRPCRGGRYDSGEDRSMSPEPPGPRCSPSASTARTCRPSTDPHQHHEVRKAMHSSSTTSRCTWPTPLVLGSSTSPPIGSPVGRI